MLSDQGMGAAAITAGIPVQESAPASVLPEKLARKIDEWRERLAQTDWVPDLGRDIGSLTWFRGLATLTLLCGFALSLLPDFGPINGHEKAALTGLHADRERSQKIAPMACWAYTGISKAASDDVRPCT